MRVNNGPWDEALARQEAACGAARTDDGAPMRLATLVGAARAADLDPVQFSLFVNRLYKQQYVSAWVAVAAQAARPYEWTAISELLGRPEFVDFVRLVGPRWNPFSLLAQLGPIVVRRELVIDAESLLASSDAWTTTVLDERYRPIAVFGSQSEATRQRVSLDPGRYLLTHRFYTDEDALRCPSVQIDGETAVASTAMPDETASYAARIAAIANGRSALFFWQHYYVFHYLRHAERYDSETVRKEFLPVGDPNNVFDYGSVSAHAALSVSVSDATLRDCRIYLTYFNELSAPVLATRITLNHWSEQRAQEDGAYLLRFVPRRRARLSSCAPEYWVEGVERRAARRAGRPRIFQPLELA